MKEILLFRGFKAFVDDEDFTKISKFKWYIKKDGSRACYAQACNGKHQMHQMHRMVMNAPIGMDVYHRNGNGLDNQKSNLIICSRSQLIIIRPKNHRSKSRYKGVHWEGRWEKWTVRIMCNGKRYWGGSYSNEEDAAKAYDTKVKELFGEFAYLNFPLIQDA